jgi:hypothetical protein
VNARTESTDFPSNVGFLNYSFFAVLCCTGSLAIECITEEFVRQQGDIAEMQAFLSLPQHRPLKEQLQEAGELISGRGGCLLAVAVIVTLRVANDQFCPGMQLGLTLQQCLPLTLCAVSVYYRSAERPGGGAERGSGPGWPAHRSRGDHQSTARYVISNTAHQCVLHVVIVDSHHMW